MSNRLFNRLEIKYKVRQSQGDIARALFKGLFKRDLHGEYLVHSIYLDSPRYIFYAEKREGLAVRVKPRVRIYRSAATGKPVKFFFELKYRYDTQVKKERVEITEKQALGILRGHIPEIDSSVLKKLHHLICNFNLRPTVSILYKREAYLCPLFDNLRLTYDSNIRSTLSAVGLDAPFDARCVIDPRELILELKYNGNLPTSVLDRIRRLELTQITVSKYASAMEDQFFRVGNRFQNLTIPSESCW